jgi:peptidoglycan/xylan/chitin deacetylase (PgdA/CDA1 family)
MRKKSHALFINCCIAVVFLIGAVQNIFADISFEKPVINDQNTLLFLVNQDFPGCPSYQTAFSGEVASAQNAVHILTCYPEKMELLSGGSILQVRNRYGTARYSTEDQSLAWITSMKHLPEESFRQAPQAVSPDGRWVCFIRKNDSSTGTLILKNTTTLSEIILDSGADFRYDSVPVKWSADSSAVIYEKDNFVYFCDPRAAAQQLQMTEQFRRIGPGSINSVCWAGTRTLFYLDHDLVYKIGAAELLTRGLYASLIGSGSVVSRLPIIFDQYHDQFWFDFSSGNIVIMQKNTVVSLFHISDSGFSYAATVFSYPLTISDGTVLSSDVLWTASGQPLLWLSLLGIQNGQKRSAVYSLSEGLKLLMSIENTGTPIISPDGSKVAFGAGNSFYVYDISSWKILGRLGGDQPVCAIWKGNTELYIGGTSFVRIWTIGASPDQTKLLFLSSAKTIFWDKNGIICAQGTGDDESFYQYDQLKNTWIAVTGKIEIPLFKLQNERYRVFTGAAPNLRYENALYVRTLTGSGVTKALFPESVVKTEPRRRASFVFDGLDSTDGLSQILNVLKTYNIPGFFFLNGEFIRRYPAESKQIVSSGYECGSLFFTTADLTSKEFVVDEAFIRRGLARNEDEFYAATGRELALLWHAPYYQTTAFISSSAEKAGYRYVNAENEISDSVTFEEAACLQKKYHTSREIIQWYTDHVHDGMIIPVSIGQARGTRRDYLYENLDLLISGLLDEGYEIVPLRSLF